MAVRWYVVNVYSGSEKKVAESLREQATLKKMDDEGMDGFSRFVKTLW